MGVKQRVVMIELVQFSESVSQFSSVQFSIVLRPIGSWGRGGGMRDDSAEALLQSILQEALVSSSGMGRGARSLMLSIQHFLCRPWRRPLSMMP